MNRILLCVQNFLKRKQLLNKQHFFLKERSVSSYIEHEDFTMHPESSSANAIEKQKQVEVQRELERERLRQADEREQQRQEMRDRDLKREMERERQREKQRDSSTDSRHASGVGLVIGNQLTNPDPVYITIIFTIQITINVLYIHLFFLF